MAEKVIRIGGASGFWGESAVAMPQLLGDAHLDYIVFDYLAEITMSIMARARARNPEAGFAVDFVSAILRPHLREIANQGHVQRSARHTVLGRSTAQRYHLFNAGLC